MSVCQKDCGAGLLFYLLRFDDYWCSARALYSVLLVLLITCLIRRWEWMLLGSLIYGLLFVPEGVFCTVTMCNCASRVVCGYFLAVLLVGGFRLFQLSLFLYVSKGFVFVFLPQVAGADSVQSVGSSSVKFARSGFVFNSFKTVTVLAYEPAHDLHRFFLETDIISTPALLPSRFLSVFTYRWRRGSRVVVYWLTVLPNKSM